MGKPLNREGQVGLDTKAGIPLLHPGVRDDPISLEELQDRVTDTLLLFSKWGHQATIETLGRNLLGGAIDPTILQDRLPHLEGIRRWDGIVGLEGHEKLMAKTQARARAHTRLEAEYLEVAREFARDLLRWCPYLECIALTGSLATGGFREGDDIDFNLFVRDGTKYIAYLLATILGLKYSWRYRGRTTRPVHATPLLPKIACINVVWTAQDTDPFVRNDASLALELIRSRPLYGSDRFQEVLDGNPWLGLYFPQIYDRRYRDEVAAGPSILGRFLEALRRHPWALRAVEMASRGVAWLIYHFVQWTRRKNPEARAHLEFMQEVKYPYEVFQD